MDSTPSARRSGDEPEASETPYSAEAFKQDLNPFSTSEWSHLPPSHNAVNGRAAYDTVADTSLSPSDSAEETVILSPLPEHSSPIFEKNIPSSIQAKSSEPMVNPTSMSDQIMPTQESAELLLLQAFEQYEQAFRGAIARQLPINEDDRQALHQLQQSLNLSNEQARAINQRILDEVEQNEAHYHQTKIRQYEQQFLALLEQGAISPIQRERLSQLQHELKLHDADVRTLEHQLMAHRLTKLTPPPQTTAAPLLDPSENQSDASTPSVPSMPPQLSSPATQSVDRFTPSGDPSTAKSDSISQASPETVLETPAPGMAVSGAAVGAAINEMMTAAKMSRPDLSQPVVPENQIDYSQLEAYLKSGEWEKADGETLDIMLRATARRASWLDRQAISELHCTTLRTIDSLWYRHSKGRFGFSAQQPIFEATQSGRASVTRFGREVGWTLLQSELVGFKYYRQLSFSLDAPIGHLPAKWFWSLPWWESVRSGGLGTGRGGCGDDAAGMLSAMMYQFVKCRTTGAE